MQVKMEIFFCSFFFYLKYSFELIFKQIKMILEMCFFEAAKKMI